MFDFLKKKEGFLMSPADGEIIDITAVGDDVFSQKILGDGFAVRPASGSVFSPADGVVTDITDTLHAYCITTDDGLEILVHIGLDTVELRGEGFVPLTEKGAKVKAGSPLARADLDLLRKRGYDPTVVTVVTNSGGLKGSRTIAAAMADAGAEAFAYKK